MTTNHAQPDIYYSQIHRYLGEAHTSSETLKSIGVEGLSISFWNFNYSRHLYFLLDTVYLNNYLNNKNKYPKYILLKYQLYSFGYHFEGYPQYFVTPAVTPLYFVSYLDISSKNFNHVFRSVGLAYTDRVSVRANIVNPDFIEVGGI